MGELSQQQKIAELKKSAIVQAEYLYHYKLIARAIGRDEDTLIIWRREDPEFSDKLEQARIRFVDSRIKQAKPEFLLERLEPEIFKQRTENDTNIRLPQPILGGMSKDVPTDDSDKEASEA